jgi:catechol 2,3-dioxygenase-like lactoylglutathione lyase family enzyme
MPLVHAVLPFHGASGYPGFFSDPKRRSSIHIYIMYLHATASASGGLRQVCARNGTPGKRSPRSGQIVSYSESAAAWRGLPDYLCAGVPNVRYWNWSVMGNVQIEQKSYEMPPREGISIAHFLTVADVERSARYYEKVFGARILSLGDGNAPGYLQLANIWMILNVGGGPTPDKPTVTLSVPDPNHINSFLNFRVADIQACYELWKSRGAEFITEPIPKYGETRCYIRDPDGYIIEVGQSTDLTYG